MSGISEQDVAAAKARLDALRQEREKVEQVVRLGKVKTLEDFERLDGRERTQFYQENPQQYADFMSEKSRVWRERLRRGNAHLDIVLDARRKGEAP